MSATKKKRMSLEEKLRRKQKAYARQKKQVNAGVWAHGHD
jgi:hypothetical protein